MSQTSSIINDSFYKITQVNRGREKNDRSRDDLFKNILPLIPKVQFL